MADHYCTTVLEFEDRFEGQILHVGTKEACEKVRDAIPGVAIKSGESPLRADLVVGPTNGDADLTAGRPWFHTKDKTDG